MDCPKCGVKSEKGLKVLYWPNLEVQEWFCDHCRVRWETTKRGDKGIEQSK